jgi:hypothetical protein
MMNMEEGGRTNEALLGKIQELAFAKTETELYLDGHPGCVAALEYYKQIVEELRGLMDEYEGTVGTIRAENEMGGTWSWVNKPWPWQIGMED